MTARPVLPATLAAAFVLAPAGAAAEGEKAPPEPRAVELRTSDGLRLHALLREPAGGGETKAAVVALHGAKEDLAAWAPAADLLVAHGVTVLAVDLRGHGGSRKQGEEDLGPRAEAGDPALWAAVPNDAAAALLYVRGTVLADAKRIGLAGIGAGAAVALVAAEKDTKVRALACVTPSPGAFGLAGGSAAVRWDGRPLGAILRAADQRGDAAAMLRALEKQPRAEAILLPGPSLQGAEFLAKAEGAAAEVAQFFLGWFDRPVLTGKGEDGVRRGGGIFISGSGSSAGCRAGGVLLGGYLAPGRIDGLSVLADPDPAARKLTTASRRISVLPGKGKTQVLSVTVERWTGTGWKADPPISLPEAGAFVVEGKTTFYEVWLPPRVLGARPFTRVAFDAVRIVEGRPRRDEDSPDPANPSAWQKLDLR